MIEPNHPIWPWLIEFAGMSLYMYKINGTDGLTSRCRTKGRASMTAKAGFGEQILYKPSKTVKIDKTEERWKDGAWLGVIDDSDERIIGAAEGERTHVDTKKPIATTHHAITSYIPPQSFATL